MTDARAPPQARSLIEQIKVSREIYCKALADLRRCAAL
jgi:hypothetical protein